VVWVTTGVEREPEARAREREGLGGGRENVGLDRASAGLSEPWTWLISERVPSRRARRSM